MTFDHLRTICQPLGGKCVFLAGLIVAVGIPDSALASTIASVLCGVIDIIVGTAGRALATLAIIFLGVGALFGKVSWGLAITVGVGISVIFNAGQIVTTLTGLGLSDGCFNTTAF